MRLSLVFMSVLVAVAFIPASATIINVPDDYLTIQQGIDASTDGDTVLVQPGTYVENINFNGHNIVLGSLFLTTGDQTYISQTIINGGSSATVVSFVSGEDTSTCITGFTITNGYTDDYGGGILCMNYSDPLICHNIIENNISDNSGAGICCRQSSPEILNNTISNNKIFNIFWGDGGGIHIFESSSLIKGNTISNNYCYCAAGGISCFSSTPMILENAISGNNTVGPAAGFLCHQSEPVVVGNQFTGNISSVDDGGGVACYSSSMIFDGNLVAYNISGFRGGGIFNNYSDSYIRNNVIVYNQCAEDGAAINCRRTWTWSNPTIINNVIYGNEAGGNGGALAIIYADPIITNTVMWNNTPDEIDQDDLSNPVITYSNIQRGWEGEGNIDVDPLFRDPENGDFHLMSIECGDPYDSPCIDVGHPDILDSLLSCDWGLGAVLSDMGAYGGRAEATDCVYTPGDCNHNGTPLELGDVIAMIGMYRGTVDPYYICDCGVDPPGAEFAATADPNANCVPFELGDVVAEIGAYRGTAEASGCPDCPGSARLAPGREPGRRLR